MKLKIFLFLVLFCVGPSLSAQLITTDYEKVKTTNRTIETHNKMSFGMILSKDKSLLAISYNFKLSQLEVYNTSTWEIEGSFSVKGFIDEHDSYFSGTEENVIHVARSRGKKMYKVNFKTNEIKAYKLNKPNTGNNTYPFNTFYRDFWEQNGNMAQYRFFDDYALIITDTTLEVYRKK